ncbi:MAG: glycerophosphodiester phosphodiesterase [Clostridia bacterium]|nr:glycerophosphodiester phosphodiesterase [Clostridia bacterium]
MLGALLILIFIAAIIFGIYLLLIYPIRNDRINGFISNRFAHRGLHSAGVPENSMAAFKAAVDHGFGIELDVRLSKDGELMVFHDDDLERVVGSRGSVIDFTADELADMSLMGTGEGIPRFADVLKMVDGRVPLLVEIKEMPNDSSVSVAAANMLKEYKGPYIIESFNPLSLMRVARILPKVPRGILSQRYLNYPQYRAPLYLALQALLLNRLCKPTFVAYHHQHASSISLKLARLLGATTYAWTVRSPEEESVAFANGFDSVIFEGYVPKK